MELTQAIRSLFDSFRSLRQHNTPHSSKQFALNMNLKPNYYSLLETSAADCMLSKFLLVCIHLHIEPWVLMEKVWKDKWPEIARQVLNKTGEQ